MRADTAWKSLAVDSTRGWFDLRTEDLGDVPVRIFMTRRLLGAFPRQLAAEDRDDSRLASLSAREREVLLDMATGLTNTEIAAHLMLSESTIKTHVSRVLAKTGARDRVHAVIIAYDAGLVRPAHLATRLKSGPAAAGHGSAAGFRFRRRVSLRSAGNRSVAA